MSSVYLTYFVIQVDFDSLTFDINKEKTDDTMEKIKKSLAELEIQFHCQSPIDVYDFIDIVDFDVWGDTISLYND